MKAGTPAIPDRRTLERVIDSSRAEARAGALSDIVVDGGRRLVLRSPNGHYWAVSVSNAGALVTTDIGTSAP